MSKSPTVSNDQSLFQNYVRANTRLVRGEGVWAYEEDGTAWLDFGSGIAVNALGHAHPHLVECVKEQCDKIWHVSNLYPIEGQEKLAERLCNSSFADQVFFCNSGAEANEAAIKTARRFFYEKGQAERVNIITFEGAFHGRTLATIAAGGQEKYLEGFGPKAPGFIQIPFADHDALKTAIGHSTAAILIEPIQGEGGLRTIPKQCLKGLRDLCDEHGILLIFDEVQTGIGRTGHLFAYELMGVTPDLLTSAKGLGGGFPVGALLSTDQVAACMKPGTHGSTFGGNMLAMAAGNAVLDIVLEDGFLESVRAKAGRLRQRLAQIVDTYPDLVTAVHGEGLLTGLKCKAPNSELVATLHSEKLMTIPAGNNVIRLMPPLIISNEEIDDGLARIDKALLNYRINKAH